MDETKKFTAHLNTAGRFVWEKYYRSNIEILNQVGVLTMLPAAQRFGVVGIDGLEYPVPTLEQVSELLTNSRELINRKAVQGFDRLEITPMAMPVSDLIILLKAAIIKHSTDGNIFQARHSIDDALIPTRVNKEKQVWVWARLEEVFDTQEMLYFPKEYSTNHHGQTKMEVIHNRSICAFPGWSIGLGESLPFKPQPGEGLSLCGRKQIELGHSPQEYLQLLQSEHISTKLEKPWKISS